MKQNVLWKVLLFLGLCPFAAPILLGLYHMAIESWVLMDWVVLYSFLYWPTYVIGLVLIVFVLCKRKK